MSVPTYRLSYRPPYDLGVLLAFYAKRAVPGVEIVDEKNYRRNFSLDGVAGRLHLKAARGNALALAIDYPDEARHAEIVANVRRMFDVDTDIEAVRAHLHGDRGLRKALRATPGLRLPGGWGVFEIAIRAVLGQQVSVAAARTLARRLVERHGAKLTTVDGEEVLIFPTPETLADADLSGIGITRSRAAALNTIARAVRDGQVSAAQGQALDTFVADWVQLPGIGDWTAQYIAMRALSHADAFPAADLALRKALARDGELIPLRDLHEMARAWQPWRAYAVLHLWRSIGE